jgi:hypothetical protein
MTQRGKEMMLPAPAGRDSTAFHRQQELWLTRILHTSGMGLRSPLVNKIILLKIYND